MRLNPTARKKQKEKVEQTQQAEADIEAEANADADGNADPGTNPHRPKTKHRRDVQYEPVLAAKICRLIAFGHSVRSICQRPGMPHNVTFYGWVRDIESFRHQYLIARQLARDRLEDETLAIADDTSHDIVFLQNADGQSRQVLNPVAVQRAKTRIATRNLLINRYTPRKKHGSTVETPLTNPAPLSPTVLTEAKRRELIARRRAALERIRASEEKNRAAAEASRQNSP